jgi:hypothetical protein
VRRAHRHVSERNRTGLIPPPEERAALDLASRAARRVVAEQLVRLDRSASKYRVIYARKRARPRLIPGGASIIGQLAATELSSGR